MSFSLLSSKSLARWLGGASSTVLVAGGVATATAACGGPCYYHQSVTLIETTCLPCPSIGGALSQEKPQPLSGCTEGTPRTCFYDDDAKDRDVSEDVHKLRAEECGSSCGSGDCVATSNGPRCARIGELEKTCLGGRRYPGLQDVPTDDRTLAAYFARMAHLEAASVVAFTGLAADLSALGAPGWLTRRCRAAALDEARHAQQMERIARDLGWADEIPAVLGERPPQSARALMLDNASEGSREAYGALVATWLARLMPRRHRCVLRSVARDEARHAALSMAIDAWLEQHPSVRDEDRREARAQRRESLREVASSRQDEAIAALGGPVDRERASREALVAVLLAA